MKPLIVGEQPSRTGDPSRPIEGRIGKRLAEYAGLSYEGFLRAFDRVNVLPTYDEGFDAAQARRRAQAIARGLRPDQTVLLLGKRVARAFDVREVYFLEQNVNGAKAYVFPHPSGLSRWWNDIGNETLAIRFLCQVTREAGR